MKYAGNMQQSQEQKCLFTWAFVKTPNCPNLGTAVLMCPLTPHRHLPAFIVLQVTGKIYTYGSFSL